LQGVRPPRPPCRQIRFWLHASRFPQGVQDPLLGKCGKVPKENRNKPQYNSRALAKLEYYWLRRSVTKSAA